MIPQNNETDEWELEAIQNRYRATHQLNLTTDQAKMICAYEQLRDTPSKNHYFSFWEEWDFERVSFQQILTPEQFENYNRNQQDAINHHEQWLVQHDKDCLNQMTATKDLLHYYESQLLPDLEKQRMIIWGAFDGDKEKVSYLKAEYKKFLDSGKKAILINHFRHSKTLQPDSLQIALLRHQLICLFPDYFSFQAGMDIPTRTVADYLEIKMKRCTEILSAGVEDILQALKDFRKANTAKHVGEIKGWHTTLPNEENNFMFLLLLDRQKYGC